MLCECDETAVNVTTCFILSYYLSLDIHNKDYFCFCLAFQLHFIAFQIHCCLQFIPFSDCDDVILFYIRSQVV